jgi:hypothetical protein
MALDADELCAIVDAIAAKGGAVSLDDVGDALGDGVILVTDVERLLFALDLRGIKVKEIDEVRPVPECLAAVLAAARQLHGASARVPTVSEIAAHARLPERSVRMALLFAKVMSRS